MDANVWRPSKKKYGVAICNYKGGRHATLGLTVGDPVHILEEYGSGATGWYRGSLFKQKDKLGIFPACLIHIKPCKVDNEGMYETVTPDEDSMVKEVAYVLREWSTNFRDLFVKNNPLFKSIMQNMAALVKLRGQLVEKKLTSEDDRDVKNEIVSVIDWGNAQLGMDLVPRIDGIQVDADNCSIVRLHRVHVESAQVADAPGPSCIFMRKDSSKGDMGAGITSHHLLTSFKNFGCNVGDSTETLLSLYQVKEDKCICLTEKFLVRHTKQSAPEDLAKLDHNYGLFTDLTNDDLEKELYLVAHIYRIGRMLQDNSSKKIPGVTFKRPWGVGVQKIDREMVGMNLDRLGRTNFKEWEFQMKVTCCSDNEMHFPSLQDQIIKRLVSGGSFQPGGSTKLGLSLTISVRILHGDLATVKKEDPMLFSKGVAIVQKLGVSDVITPAEVHFTETEMCEVRNDLYVTLKEADFKRGSKKAEKNVEVKVTIFDDNGKQIMECMSYGCGVAPKSDYFSSVYYHSNHPEWNEAIRLSVPIDVFPGSTICFELFHCSVRKAAKKPFGFAFVRVTNKDQIVIKDGVHELCVYKYVKWHTTKLDERYRLDIKKYLNLPFLVDDLNDPTNINRIPTSLMFKANERESLTIATMLCSGKFTQNGDLLGILNWRGDRMKVAENLVKLSKMQGEEIVKFLHDILDALFELFIEEQDTENLSFKIFQALVNIFTLIHHARFETFKPVLEAYITDIFSATLVHKPMCECFCEMIDLAMCEQRANFQLVQSFQAMDYIFKFIVQSRELQRKDVFSRGSGDATEFQSNIKKLFHSMGDLLASKSSIDSVKTHQKTLISHLHMVYSPLLQVMTERDVCELVDICLRDMPNIHHLHEDITGVKLELLRKTVATKLFTHDDSRTLLLQLCLRQVTACLQNKIKMKLAIDLMGDIMDRVFELKQSSNIEGDIQMIISNMFDVVMETVIHLSGGSPTSPKGAIISSLTEMLRLMEEEHYDALLHVYHRGAPLKEFLKTIFTVFKLLVQPNVFPMDWTVMRMVTNNVVFTAIEYLSQALKDNYIAGDKFDSKLWTSYFNLAVAFITQPSLQLDRYSAEKAQKLKERYQDMRVLMGVQVETLWQSLGKHKEYFIPELIGPFLELTLVPEREVRKATLPIIFDMMEADQKRHKNFKKVEAALIERLDFFLTQEQHGDIEYMHLFRQILLERVQADESLRETGPQFIISVTHLLERLLDYRQVVDGEENRDKRMHCTVNILNFYKDEINREEMYIRYVNKLHELHNHASNHAEAGLTLQLYAKVLTWSDEMLPKEMRYNQEPECKRKEMLYTQIINCFDKGKVWEYAIPLCKDLAEYYETKLDYKKLGDILKLQASFYQKILEGVPGQDPSQPDVFIPRQDPSYYRVAYYGQTFPTFLRNKQFIYRGDECLKLATIISHMTAEFPTAQIIPNTQNQLDTIKEGDQQYIQICPVKAVAAERPEFRGKDIPMAIKNFYSVNEVDTFHFDRPYHRTAVDKNNETKSLCIERTKMKTAYKFPGILRWYEVVNVEVEMISPIGVAKETIRQCNSDFLVLIEQCSANPKLYFSQLEMKLQGVISAAVNGGITKYHESFFTSEFEREHPDEAIFLDELKALLNQQVEILARGLKLHGNMVPDDLKPLHKNLEQAFKKMRHAVKEHNSMHGSKSDLRPLTPDSVSLGSTGSTSSLYQDHMSHPNELAYSRQSRGSNLSFSVDPDTPPPVPTRPRSIFGQPGHQGTSMNGPFLGSGEQSQRNTRAISKSMQNLHGGTGVRRHDSDKLPPKIPIPSGRRPSAPTIYLQTDPSPAKEQEAIQEEPSSIPALPEKNKEKNRKSLSSPTSSDVQTRNTSSDKPPVLPPRNPSTVGLLATTPTRLAGSSTSRPSMSPRTSAQSPTGAGLQVNGVRNLRETFSPGSSLSPSHSANAPPPIPSRKSDTQKEVPPLPATRNRDSNSSTDL